MFSNADSPRAMAPPHPSASPSCWILTDGNVGMEVQCVGLAEALDLEPEVKRIDLSSPWRALPPQLIVNPLARLSPQSDRLTPPWPALVIASGRKSVAPAMAIRRKAAGATYVIQIQNPAVDASNFDLVIAPVHDGVAGDNVIETIGSLGRVTSQVLAEARGRFQSRFGSLARPRVAVLIGGRNRAYRFTPAIAQKLVEDLSTLARQGGAGLMVTTSRRTSASIAAVLKQGLSNLGADIWTGEGDNPYFGMLAHADHVIVTGDSVNMISEAASTGRPVHVVRLEGGSTKFERFHRAAEAAGIARPFTGKLETWTYEPLRETERVAGEVRRRWPFGPSV